MVSKIPRRHQVAERLQFFPGLGNMTFYRDVGAGKRVIGQEPIDGRLAEVTPGSEEIRSRVFSNSGAMADPRRWPLYKGETQNSTTCFQSTPDFAIASCQSAHKQPCTDQQYQRFPLPGRTDTANLSDDITPSVEGPVSKHVSEVVDTAIQPDQIMRYL